MSEFKSIKYQTTIFYYPDDIGYCDSGEYACTGVGNDGHTYDITFEDKNGTFYIKDVNRK